MNRVLALAMAGIVPLSEPGPANPIVAAESWVQGVLLGSVATAVAVVAVAAFGLLLLAGRLRLRRGLTMVAGCFVLFGSHAIATGILAGLGTEPVASQADQMPPIIAPPSPLVNAVPSPSATPYDPYAGAAVPQHR